MDLFGSTWWRGPAAIIIQIILDAIIYKYYALNRHKFRLTIQPIRKHKAYFFLLQYLVKVRIFKNEILVYITGFVGAMFRKGHKCDFTAKCITRIYWPGLRLTDVGHFKFPIVVQVCYILLSMPILNVLFLAYIK